VYLFRLQGILRYTQYDRKNYLFRYSLTIELYFSNSPCQFTFLSLFFVFYLIYFLILNKKNDTI